MKTLAGLLVLVATSAVLIARTAPSTTAQESAAVVEPQRAVLITGASTGIGRCTAELLAARGFYVYAGARSQADIDALNVIDNVQGVRLDVTVQADIDAAVETVRKGGRGLFGLINNAGVVVLGPLVELSDEDLRFQFDVNVFGPQRVTKAFAPLLIESQGRVATTGSISGFVTWGLGGPYTMSKHAVEAWSDTLGAELSKFNVQVCVVEPGNFRSHIMDNTVKRLLDAGYSPEGSLFEDSMRGLLERPTDRAQYPEPTAVAEAFARVLTAERAPRRVMVVPNAREAELTLRAAAQRLVELNTGSGYTLDRDALVKLVDEALANTAR